MKLMDGPQPDVLAAVRHHRHADVRRTRDQADRLKACAQGHAEGLAGKLRQDRLSHPVFCPAFGPEDDECSFSSRSCPSIAFFRSRWYPRGR